MIKRYGLLILLLCITCTPPGEWPPIVNDCTEQDVGEVPLDFLRDNYEDGVYRIRDSIVIRAFVNSSDEAGNFFNTLYLQDHLTNPKNGMSVLLDMRNSYSKFPPGSEVIIKLPGLYMKKKAGSLTLGFARQSFGNLVVSAIPSLRIPDFLRRSCAETKELSPTPLSIRALDTMYLQQLILVEGVEVIEAHRGLPMAEAEMDSERVFEDCAGDQIVLNNSGFADFANAIIPDGNGSISGILTGKPGNYELQIRNLDDLNLVDPHCDADYPLMATDSVFISEIADPDNEPGARFIELYNASAETVSLRNWQLLRYTNGNTQPGNAIEIGRVKVLPGDAISFSANPADYQRVYGQQPDVEVVQNSAADSNGDDNMVLIDAEGRVVDIFGIIGEDGSGTAHEFEDGRALRKDEIRKGSPIFTPAEWLIANDSGGNGTVKFPKIAPEDFTPSTH